MNTVLSQLKLISKSASNMLHAHGITLKALPLKIVWLKADILPTYSEGSDDENEIIMGDRENREDNADILIELARLKELEEVQVLIDKLDIENPFTAEEF